MGALVEPFVCCRSVVLVCLSAMTTDRWKGVPLPWRGTVHVSCDDQHQVGALPQPAPRAKVLCARVLEYTFCLKTKQQKTEKICVHDIWKTNLKKKNIYNKSVRIVS